MLRKLSEPLQKLFGFVGASLTGITAVFTAAGFLAERARLTMLGLPSTTFDLQQYLETGARFLAFLPLYLGMAFYYSVLGVLSALLNWLAGRPVVAVVLLLAAALSGILWVYMRRRRKAARAARADAAAGEAEPAAGPFGAIRRFPARFVGDHLTGLLFVFLLVQFLGAYQLTQALEVSNLLFEPTLGADTIPHATFSIVKTETLKNWIVAGQAVQAAQYLGWLFLITLLTGWGLHFVLKLYRESGLENPRFWQITWFAGSLLLLLTQVTLLPINYGILLTSNRFVEVTVVYAEAEAEDGARPLEDPLYLLHETGSGFYFYSSTLRKVWYVLRSDVRSIQHHRMVRILQPASTPP